VHELVKKYVPERRRRNHNRPPWLSRNILREIRRKKRLWKSAKEGAKLDEYKAAEKKVRNLIRNAKRNFEKKIARGSGSEQNSKRKFHAYVRQRTKTKPGIGPLKDNTGRVVQEDAEMANLLNKFFSSVFTREDTTTVPEPERQQYRQEIWTVSISARKVKEKIRKLHFWAGQYRATAVKEAGR
jgi:hypothetical protein